MSISAAQVKELRERTGSGMMECKKALVEAKGDMEAAVELLRKSGLAKADKKAGRVAAEGLIVIETDAGGRELVMAEVNCETDFVARKDEFQAFARAVAQAALRERPAGVEALSEVTLEPGGQDTVETARRELVAKLGENIAVRRFSLRTLAEGSVLGMYLHGNRIGVVVELKGGDETLAKDLAMHIAASKPVCVRPEDVPAELLDKEREIIRAQAETSGKPPEIIEKMTEGRIKKYLAEITLLGQPFVKDPDTAVGKLLEKSKAEVLGFERMELGEGIEKKAENFAEEVMAQVRGS